MPMKMGIHCKSMGHGRSAFLDSRLYGNDGSLWVMTTQLSWIPAYAGMTGGMVFPKNCLKLLTCENL